VSSSGGFDSRRLHIQKPSNLKGLLGFFFALVAWLSMTLTLYGERKQVQYKELVARWYRSAGKSLLKIVIVRVPRGELPLRVFFCTDSSRTARQVIESYASRWGIEVLFRDLKQLLGFSSSRARSPLAVLRTARWDTSRMGLPLRPWYRTQCAVSFADILRLAQRTPASAESRMNHGSRLSKNGESRV